MRLNHHGASAFFLLNYVHDMDTEGAGSPRRIATGFHGSSSPLEDLSVGFYWECVPVRSRAEANHRLQKIGLNPGNRGNRSLHPSRCSARQTPNAHPKVYT